MNVIKIGRTHLQDAVLLTVGQEWSGYACQLNDAILRMEECRKGLYALAVGGTAVGTGLDVPHWFADDMAKEIVLLTRKPFITAPTSLLHKVLWTACLCRP